MAKFEIFFLCVMVAFASAQTITFVAPGNSILYAGFAYNLQWTSSALASTTPLTIELWNDNSPLPDTKVLTIVTNAPNTGSYPWTIPTNDTSVLGTNEMYFYIYVTGGSTASPQQLGNTIKYGSIVAFTPSSGAVLSIGQTYNVNFTYDAPTTATVLIGLYRNTNPLTTVSTLVSSWPVTTVYPWTLANTLTPSADYFIGVFIEQDVSHASANSAVFTVSAATTAPPTQLTCSSCSGGTVSGSLRYICNACGTATFDSSGACSCSTGGQCLGCSTSSDPCVACSDGVTIGSTRYVCSACGPVQVIGNTCSCSGTCVTCAAASTTSPPATTQAQVTTLPSTTAPQSSDVTTLGVAVMMIMCALLASMM